MLKEKSEHTLNKPFRTPGGPKKFSVYVKNDKGNVVKVNFGDSTGLTIKRDQPKRRAAYRARHGCDDPGPKWKANYWSCRMWTANKTVSDVLNDSADEVTLDDVLFEMSDDEESIAKQSGKLLARDFTTWARDKYKGQKPSFKAYLNDVSSSAHWRADWFGKFLGAVEKSFDQTIKKESK